nr:GTP pyrophosphokinase family protein [Corynebacterium sp. sy017]
MQRLHSFYQKFVNAHPDAPDDLVDTIEDVLSDAGLTFDRVSGRLKEWQSLKAKAKKRTASGELMYPQPWNDIHDLIGIRITTFHSTDIPQIVEVLKDTFIVHRSVDKAAQTRIAGGFGYGSHHLILEVDHASQELSSYAGHQFEVQIRTVLQHAWAEFEHDIRYKRNQQELDPRIDRAFTLAAGLIELADQQFDQIAAIKQPETPQDNDLELSPQTLPGILAMIVGTRFPQSRMQDYRFLDELLTAHDITSVASLRSLLNDQDIEAVSSAFKYRFQPGQIRIIDDLLLYRYREDHIKKTEKIGKRALHRPAKLKHRLEMLTSAT